MLRRSLFAFALLALASAAGAQPKDAYKSAEGRFAVKFPGEPKANTPKDEKTAVGNLKLATFTYATSDNNIFILTYTDFPAGATKPENRGALFDSVREAIRTKDGKLVGAEKEFEFGPDKLPAREFTVDKGKQRTRYRVVLNGSRLYQQGAIGTAEFAGGKDATAFFDSFTLIN
jgi:hypothetical protein